MSWSWIFDIHFFEYIVYEKGLPLPAAIRIYGSIMSAFKLGASSSHLTTFGFKTNNCKPEKKEKGLNSTKT